MIIVFLPFVSFSIFETSISLTSIFANTSSTLVSVSNPIAVVAPVSPDSWWIASKAVTDVVTPATLLVVSDI